MGSLHLHGGPRLVAVGSSVLLAASDLVMLVRLTRLAEIR
jgi:hypothetical protein